MIDLIASAPRVPKLGETVIGTSFQTAPGGKGANQALQCARLDADVTMVGCVGTEAFGQEMLEVLKQAEIDVSHVKISNKGFSGVGHIQLEVKEDGVQNRILVVPGSNGAILCDGEHKIQVPCVHMPDVKDPTAAGDSFIASFCTGVAGGLSEEDALRMAAYTAAITVCGMGAMPSLPTMEQVLALMKERGELELADKICA